MIRDLILGGGGFREINLVINGLVTPILESEYNVYTEAGSPRDKVRVNLSIINGAIVSRGITTVPNSGSWFPGSELRITNNGYIYGTGGQGGGGGVALVFYSPPSVLTAYWHWPYTPGRGEDGGNALTTNIRTIITNNGQIFGGGGGGGGGSANHSGPNIPLPTPSGTGGPSVWYGDFEVVSSTYYAFVDDNVFIGGAGGGGGRGYNNAEGGGGGTGTVSGFFSNDGSRGSDGSSSAGGAGGGRRGQFKSNLDQFYYNGIGGQGGDWGQDGENGGKPTPEGKLAYLWTTSNVYSWSYYGGPGGNAGRAVKLVNIPSNQVVFLSGNNSDQVKGGIG